MINKTSVLISFVTNATYGIILLNIASAILLFAHYFNIPYEASITFVIIYFALELLLFFSPIPSLGIIILSIVFFIPYIFIKKMKVTQILEIPRRLKHVMSYIAGFSVMEIIESDSVWSSIEEKKPNKPDTSFHK